MRNSPIGVFDSGVGGLTVFRAIKKRLPHESIIYFGDTAHVPYGSKSKEAVSKYSLMVGRFLADQGVKLLVVACNTASALALSELRKRLKIPVIDVIRPGVRAANLGEPPPLALSARERGRLRAGRTIGVIATEATIASGSYQFALERASTGTRVIGVACPLFVPLVEEGWWNHPVTRDVAREYLKPLKRANAGSVILGCTHYPVIKPVIQAIMGRKVRLIDSADQVALETQRVLSESNLLSHSKVPTYRFFASDGPERFMRLAGRFLGSKIDRVSVYPLD